MMHKSLAALTAVLCALTSIQVRASFDEDRSPERSLAVQDMVLSMPNSWHQHQDALDDGTIIMGFTDNSEYLTLFVKHQTGLSAKAIFLNGSQVVNDLSQQTVGSFTWQRLDTKKTTAIAQGNVTFYVSSFLTEYRGYTYYGYSRSKTVEDSSSNVKLFLDSLATRNGRVFRKDRSLTGPSYGGKKYYFGFGDALSGFMGNEVKYDVYHTHDIFTKELGGSYVGEKIISKSGGHAKAFKAWEDIRSEMTFDDMYVQYSSGHGSRSALMFGVDYEEIRDNVLSMPAKEMIVFIMSCYSGNLVNSFDKKKDEWKDWGKQGRTLMVMASSRANESSATGPSSDPDEISGPSGSAGSAFGHSLWKALIGYADGYLDGVKDGYISLGEIEAFVRWKTKKLGGHTPVTTGVYNPNLIMNRVPSAKAIRSLGGRGTEDLTDAQIEARVRALDAELRVR